jgi:hypothetical protein
VPPWSALEPPAAPEVPASSELVPAPAEVLAAAAALVAPSVRRRPGVLAMACLALTVVGCLVAAAAAGEAAHAALTRKPTAAQRSAAAAAAVARRWRSWPAGRIFPATLPYRTVLPTTETASRIGISPADSCTVAVDATLRLLAVRQHCLAALRATYVDELQGVVYTVGVLAFPGAGRAASFLAGLPADRNNISGLRALAFPGTASGRFTDAARQAATASREGPFVVLTVAGYADGRPAAFTQERRSSVFAPAVQLAAEIIGPLNTAPTVNCTRREWSC